MDSLPRGERSRAKQPLPHNLEPPAHSSSAPATCLPAWLPHLQLLRLAPLELRPEVVVLCGGGISARPRSWRCLVRRSPHGCCGRCGQVGPGPCVLKLDILQAQNR